MKKMFLAITLLMVGVMQANKVLVTGQETPEEMQAIVDKYGIKNGISPITPAGGPVRTRTNSPLYSNSLINVRPNNLARGSISK